MKIAVLSDVHSNLDALEAVLADIRREKVDQAWFLGDAVGYGPEPVECLESLGPACRVMLRGNHDAGAVGLTDIDRFNPHARTAVLLNAAMLSPVHRELLAGLPLEAVEEGFRLAHASPWQPGEWHYVLHGHDIGQALASFQERFCIVGHSHRPMAVEETSPGEWRMIDFDGHLDRVRFARGRRYLLNVGSVGQPRDGNWKAAWVLLDLEAGTAVMHRVPYDFQSVQRKMADLYLPPSLIARLAKGL